MRVINTIFKKQFILYMGVILITFAMLGIVLSIAFNSYFTLQKKESLIRQGEKISELYARSFTGSIYDYIQLPGQFDVLSEYLDASYLFVAPDFTVIDVSPDINKSYVGRKIDIPEFKPVMESAEIVSEQIRIPELFNESMLAVCYPFIINNRIIGALLMTSSIPELQRTISEAYRIGLWCLLASAVLAFIMIFISSKTMSKPLREMNENAKIIAGGNFDTRIEVKGKDEVAQLAQSLNNMATSLSRQEEARKEFIANISHDFRSPLTSIRGFLQAILDGTVPPEKQNYYLSIVLDETERLSKLSNDILDLNKIQSLNMDFDKDTFDINELIRQTVTKFEKRILDKNMDMQVVLSDEVTYVRADYEKISRVIYNLVDNAVKFTHEGGEIRVETTLKDRKILISVKDNGPGIEESEKTRVFERFYKADMSRGEDKMGSGIGLAIVKEFINSHGEDITLETKKGEGSSFTFSLPVQSENISG